METLLLLVQGALRCARPRRRPVAEVAAPAHCLPPAECPAPPSQERPFHIAVTSLSGERFELPPLPPDALLREVKEKVKERWGMPILVQRLAQGTRLIEAADEATLGRVMVGVKEEEGVVELSCVASAVTEELQTALDEELLRSTARGNHAEMVEALSEGARPGETGFTCLAVAIAARDSVACELLRAAHAPEPDMRPEMVWHIREAFRRGDLVEVLRSLAQGHDPNTQLRQGEGLRDTHSGTALHAICAMHRKPGATALVELLCRLGADIAAPDSEGDSPLSHARYNGADEIFKVLEEHGARLQGPYYSAFHIAGRRFLGWQ